MSTYSASITNGITLTNFAAQNPVTITHTGTIAPPGTNAIGVHGTGLNAWTIDNDGLISTPATGGVGVYLSDGGSLTNEASATISANLTSGLGVLLNAGGTVTNQTSAAITGFLGVYDRNAAATVVNAGLISAASTGSASIVLVAGGVVTNQLSGTITGVDGVFANNAAATVVNAGGISGAYDAVLFKNGGTVFNQPLGTIDGADYGVKLSGTLASVVTNQGVIIGQAGAGIGMATGGTISNAASAAISGGSYGIDTYIYAATVINLGTIVGQGSAIDLFEGGSISNAASAAILAGDYGVKAAGVLAATVTNQGEIFGETRAGVVFLAGGSVNNAESAAILGGAYGVAATNTTATVMNQGTISGPGNIGVLFLDGGYVSNATTGTITGAYFGVEISTTIASVTNFGSISSAAVFNGSPSFDAAGVDLHDGGTVINGPTGDIRATFKGVEIGAIGTNVGGTLLNQGVVYASSDGGSIGADAWIHGPGLISNAATGTIAGGRYGVVAYYQTTVVNRGSIGGTQFAVFNTPGFADRVVVAPGASFSGLVSGGNTIGASVVSTLELTSGASTGTLHGLGAHYVDFVTVTIDAGAAWTWVSDAIGAGYTITDAGTLTNTGSLGSSVTLGAGAVLTNTAGGTITGPAVYSASTSVGVSVTNAGVLIDSGTAASVELRDGGYVSNASTGIIMGVADGVYITGRTDTVMNAGSILASGTSGDGIYLIGGGLITNTASATIGSALYRGIAIAGGAGTLVNAGQIFSDGAHTGVDLFAGGIVTNQSGGTITGGISHAAVYFTGAAGTVTNYGLLTAPSASGIVLDAGGTVSNASTGRITGLNSGVLIIGAVGTVVNAGSISGANVDAVQFAAGFANRLVVDPGALFGGEVNGGGALSTLEFSAGTGGIESLSGHFVNFGTFQFDSDTDWTLNGANTITAGATLTELSGANLIVTGTLVNDGVIVIDPSTLIVAGLIGTGSVTIDADSTVTIAGSVSAGETIVFAGTDAVLNIADPTGFAGTVQAQGPTDQVNTPRTLVWTGAQNTDFANAFNWDDLTTPANPASRPPGMLDTAEFLATGGTVTGTATVAILQFGSLGQWLLGSGAALTAESGITVGNGALAVEGGASIASAGSVDLISGTGGLGAAVTVSGTNAIWTGEGNLIVGDAGLGSLAIATDGTVISTAAIIANAASAGGSSVNVTGTNSNWQISGALAVGNASTGLLAITNGATVSATTLDAGVATTGAGIITVSGPDADLLTTGTVSIGDAGSGELSILDGANATIGGDLDIANAGTGTGNVDLEDTTGTITLGGNVWVGYNGFGVFNVGYNVDYIQNDGGINFGPDSSGAINSFADPSPFLSNASPNPIAIGAQGVDQLAAYLFNSGEFTIPNGHALTFETPIIYGGGAFALGSGDSLVLNAGTVSGQTFTLGANDTLTIGIDNLATIDIPPSGTSGFTAEANPDQGALLVGNFGGVIADFTAGDTIEVDTHLASASAGTLSQNGSVVSVIEIANGATLGALTFDSAANATAAINDGAIALEVVPCFAAGTRIATARGEIAVEAIGVGEKVRVLLGGAGEETAGEGFSEVIWVGRREVDCARHAQPRNVWPVRVAVGAFGPGLPHSELWLSPDHAVYVNDVLIPVKHLINGSSIVQVPVDRVTYHHIELAQHDVLLAEGLPAESFLDMRDGSNYANRPGPTRLYPDFSARMWEAFGCARLIVAGPEVLAARAMVAVAEAGQKTDSLAMGQKAA